MSASEYNRDAIRKRYRRYIEKLEKWGKDIETLIAILLESGYRKKAADWGLLVNSIEVVRDLWLKLIEEL